jgi:hypothetical protein
MKQVKLYDLRQGAKIKCECDDGSSYVIFDHVDGMYSYCETEKGSVMHLCATTPLKKELGYYLIDQDD